MEDNLSLWHDRLIPVKALVKGKIAGKNCREKLQKSKGLNSPFWGVWSRKH
jgi:hypothetical protein